MTEKIILNPGWKQVHPLSQAALASIYDDMCVHEGIESASMDESMGDQPGEERLSEYSIFTSLTTCFLSSFVCM